MIKQCLYIVFVFFTISYSANAQCDALISVDPATGEVNPTFTGNFTAVNVQVRYSFNEGSMPLNWNMTPYVLGELCEPSVDLTEYYWTTDVHVDGSRFVETQSMDVTKADNIYFDLKYGSDPGPPCEEPDEAVEAVFLQYSIDNGTSWNSIDTWPTDPTNNAVGDAYFWNTYTYPIPPAAKTSATMFRWYQQSNSGKDYDHWGLDNVVIGFPATVEWDFGDGSPVSHNQYEIHTFPGYGNYNVSLTVAQEATSATAACSDTYTMVYAVNSLPTIDPIADQTNVNSVGFTGVTDGGIGGQVLSVSAVSSNPSVITGINVNYNSADDFGSLDFTYASNLPNSQYIVPVTVNVSYTNIRTVTKSITFYVILTFPEINVLGRANLSVLDGDLSPRELDGTDYGDVLVSLQKAQTFEIWDIGHKSLNVSDITLSNTTDFFISPLLNKSEIPPNEKGQFAVVFRPTSAGIKTCTVTIFNDDIDESVYDFVIQGNGLLVPEVSVLGKNSQLVADNSTAPNTTNGTDFGSIPLNTVVSQVFTIRNTGQADLNIGPVTLTGDAAFTVTQPSLFVLPPNTSTTFEVFFSAASSNPYNGTISFSTNDIDENPYNFNIKGAGNAQPEIIVTGKDNLEIVAGDLTPWFDDGTDFGNVLVGQTVRQTFTITNTGSLFLFVMSINASNLAELKLLGAPISGFVLNPGESYSFEVEFTPTTTDPRILDITIMNNDPNEVSYVFRVQGKGFAAPEIDVSGNGFAISNQDFSPEVDDGTDFGQVMVGNTISRIFTIENLGTYELNVTNITSSLSDFTIQSTLPFVIPIGGSQSFVVEYTPSDGNPHTSLISIVNDDADENPYEFSVQGIGVYKPIISVEGNKNLIVDGDISPSVSDFTDYGNLLVGTSVENVFVVKNTGNIALNINNINVGASLDFNIVSFVPFSVPVMGEAQFTVAFDPTSEGLKQAMVSIGNDDPDNAVYEFFVQGNGIIKLDINVSGNGIEIPNGDITPGTADDTDFGQIFLSTSLQHVFTITNAGNGILTLGTLSLDDGTHFNIIQPLTNTISVGGSVTFTVEYDPADENTHLTKVNIPSDAPDKPLYVFTVKGESFGLPDIAVSGNGVGIPIGDTTPEIADNTDFDEILLGTKLQHIFTIENTGNGELTLGSLSMGDDTHFNIIQPLTNTVSVGGSVTFTIEYEPADLNTHTTTVEIPNDDPDESPYVFTIKGKSFVQPDIYVSGNNQEIPIGDTTPETADNTDFGEILLGTKLQHVFTIKNTGNGDLNLGSLTLSDGTHFNVIQPLTSTVSVGGSVTFTIEYEPADENTHTTTIEIPSDDPDESSYVFTIKGKSFVQSDIYVSGNGLEIPIGDITPEIADDTDFGEILLGTKIQHVFTISNVGNGDLILGNISLGDNTHFNIIQPITNTVSFGGSVTFTVEYEPADVNPHATTIQIPSDDPDESLYIFTVLGKSFVQPDIYVSGNGNEILNGDTTPEVADDTDFGEMLLGTKLQHVFTISNTGNGNLILGSLSLGDDTHFNIIQPITNMISIGGSVTFTVEYDPADENTHITTIETPSDDPDESTYVFTIRGKSFVQPDISVSGNSKEILNGDATPEAADDTDFGEILLGTKIQHVFTIANTGNGALSLGAISLDDDTHFNIIQPISTTVSVGGSVLFIIEYEPFDENTHSTTVEIPSDDPDENPYVFNVKGKSFVRPNIYVSGNNLEIPNGDTSPEIANGTYFGEILLGTKLQRVFTIINTGNGSLTLGTLSLGDDSHFNILQPETNLVSVGGSVTFTVEYEPVNVNTHETTVEILSDAPDESPYVFTVQGKSFVQPDIYVSGKNDIIIENLDYEPGLLDGTDFGDVMVGFTSSHVFNIYNRGNGTLRVTDVALSNENDFKLLIDGLSSSNKRKRGEIQLPEGANVPFTVEFSPSVQGNKEVFVSIASNDNDEPNYQFLVSGNALDLNRVVVSIENNGDFERVFVGNTKKMVIEIKNFTQNIVRLQNITLLSDVFYLGAFPEELKSGEKVFVDVFYEPSTYSGTEDFGLITILHTAENSPLSLEVHGFATDSKYEIYEGEQKLMNCSEIKLPRLENGKQRYFVVKNILGTDLNLLVDGELNTIPAYGELEIVRVSKGINQINFLDENDCNTFVEWQGEAPAIPLSSSYIIFAFLFGGICLILRFK